MTVMPEAPAAIDWIIDMATTIPGWREGEEAKALAIAAYGLQPNPSIVEVGTYMGRSTALMAGARRLHGDGRIHCVDAFNCSGDAFSVPYYLEGLEKSGTGSLEKAFRLNIERLSLECMVIIHKGNACDVAAGWGAPIDLLLLDADQSPTGARQIFESWIPFLKPNGIVVLGNTAEREYAATHDGNYRLAKERIRPPHFKNIYRVDGATFATRGDTEDI
jgi:predicted O-methyltransferase YrrM